MNQLSIIILGLVSALLMVGVLASAMSHHHHRDINELSWEGGDVIECGNHRMLGYDNEQLMHVYENGSGRGRFALDSRDSYSRRNLDRNCRNLGHGHTNGRDAARRAREHYDQFNGRDVHISEGCRSTNWVDLWTENRRSKDTRCYENIRESN